MNFNALKSAANDVIDAIYTDSFETVTADVLTSIKNQMVFIRDAAAAGKDPAAELPSGTKFTYAVLASRELASPDELLLQAKIDKVTRILIKA
ncbi:hypothetical protein [Rheinheimera fenheensis]|uniref:hypothetical protein n=1 Tax=Rheinheimera fenheensis TaxID=3152295 RepID=UPI003261D4B6